MANDNHQHVASAAKKIYEEQLREALERSHMDEFVAIEPISGDYFLGQTLSEAIGAARSRHPDRLAHAMRVGHRAAVHFGLQGVSHSEWCYRNQSEPEALARSAQPLALILANAAGSDK